VLNTTYEVESKIEENHWWFVGRRKLFGQIIESLALSKDSNVLDIGTSTGSNLRMLRTLGFINVRGLDLFDEAIEWCDFKGLGKVDKGDVCNIPHKDCIYDLILATDIIEHVENDQDALKEIHRVLKKSAVSIITVPAFEILWGLQDEVSQHKRRYSKRDLLKKIKNSGLTVEECYYFNYLLFLPILFIRKIVNFFDIKLHSENQLNSSFINLVLTKLFSLDIKTASKIKPPFGVSLIVIVRK
jgi:SAM-dependent methyltransferase